MDAIGLVVLSSGVTAYCYGIVKNFDGDTIGYIAGGDYGRSFIPDWRVAYDASGFHLTHGDFLTALGDEELAQDAWELYLANLQYEAENEQSRERTRRAVAWGRSYSSPSTVELSCGA